MENEEIPLLGGGESQNLLVRKKSNDGRVSELEKLGAQKRGGGVENHRF